MNIIDIIKQGDRGIMEQYMNNITEHVFLSTDDVLWLIENGWEIILEWRLINMDYKSKIIIWDKCRMHLFNNNDYISMIRDGIDEEDIIEYINDRIPSVRVIVECYKNSYKNLAHRIQDMCKIYLTIEDEELVDYGIDMIEACSTPISFTNMGLKGVRKLLENNLLQYVDNTSIYLRPNELDSLMVGCEDRIMSILPILELDHDLLEHICNEYSQYLTNMDNYVIDNCPLNICPFLSYKCLIRLYDEYDILDYILARADRPDGMTYFLTSERIYLLLDKIRHSNSTIYISCHSIYTALLIDKLMSVCKYNLTLNPHSATIIDAIICLQYKKNIEVKDIDCNVDLDIIRYCSHLFPLGYKRFIKQHPNKVPISNNIPKISDYPSDIIVVSVDV